MWGGFGQVEAGGHPTYMSAYGPQKHNDPKRQLKKGPAYRNYFFTEDSGPRNLVEQNFVDMGFTVNAVKKVLVYIICL